MSDITISYKGSSIATMDASGTKTLLTEGKYCEDDIEVVYVHPGNTYTQSDEGKVVSNGALVAQTSDTVTTNDTYDTTLINSLTVNVSGGGGGGLQLLETVTVPSDTRAVNLDFSSYTSYDILLVYADVTLTSADWLYFVQNGASPSGGTYTNQSIVNQTGVVYEKLKIIGIGNTKHFIANNTNFAINETNTSNLYVYTYSASKSIVTGSTFKIYGGNYADL